MSLSTSQPSSANHPPSKKARYGPNSAGNFLDSFAQRAKIPTFDSLTLKLPGKEVMVNDTLKIPHYGANDFTIFGKQRRGIAQSIVDATDYQDHVERASKLYSPWAINSPLPEDLSNALDVIAFSKPADMRSFWKSK